MSTTAVRVTRTEELSGVIRSAVVTVVGSATTGPIGPVGPTGPTGPTGATGPVVPLDGLLDVVAPNPISQDFLRWNGSSWVNSPIFSSQNTFTTNQIISGSTSTNLLRITQTGAGNALLVEDSTNPDSTPFVIDATGIVVAGHTSSLVVSGTQKAMVQAHSTIANRDLSAIASVNWNSTNSSSGAQFTMSRSRSGTVGTSGAIITGDQMGRVAFVGDDGSAWAYSSAIIGLSEGTISTGVIPGVLLFQTANSAGTLTERMRIDSAGRFGIGANSTAGRGINYGIPLTGGAQPIGIFNAGAIQSDATSGAVYYSTWSNTAAGAGAIPIIVHYQATQGTIGASSSMGTHVGFLAASTLTGGSSNWGFQGDIASGTGRYNLYMSGTAANYLLGRLGVGATLTSGAMAQVVNTTAGDTVFVVKGAASQTGDLIAVNNSAGTKLWHINSSNSIGHGVTTATTTGFIADAGLVAKTSTAFGPQYVLGNKTNDANAGYIILEKDRAGAIVSSGDFLGNIQFRGYDGANYRPAAMISGAVDTGTGTDDMPGRLTFSTTADGTSTLTERMRIDSVGQVGIGGTPAAGRTLTLAKPMTGAVSSFAVLASYQVASDVISTAESFRSNPNTAAASFTLANLIHFRATQATIGAGSAVTTQYGFWADSSMTGATTNIGYFGNLAASAATRFNLYMDGTAPNYLLGRVGIGTTSSSGPMLLVQNTNASDGAVTIRGAASQTGSLLSMQNSASVALVTVDSSGQYVYNGTQSYSPTSGVVAGIQSHSTSTINTSISTMRWANDNAQSFFIMSKSRGVAVGTHASVASGDALGTLLATASDGTSFIEAARIGFFIDGTPSTGVMPGRIVFATSSTSGANVERMRIDSSGNVGIGGITAAGYGILAQKNITGAINSYGMVIQGQIQSDVTSGAAIFTSAVSTAAASFTLGTLTHFSANGISTPGAGSAITNQIGFRVTSTTTGATNNWAFQGAIASATGAYNLYMSGTAANYMAGRLGVGATLTSGAMAQVTNTTAADKAFVVKGAASQTGNLFEIQNSAATALTVVDSSGQVGIGAIQAATGLNISKSITGNVNAQAIRVASSVASDVTGEARYMTIVPSVNASVAAGNLVGIRVYGATLGSGASVGSQFGFFVDSGFTTATSNNYGFYGAIASGTGRWNFYANGTARNYFAGGLEVVAGTTSMTTGFTHVPAAAGAPTGAPTNPTGNTPLYYDTTNNKLYVYNGAWKSVSLT